MNVAPINYSANTINIKRNNTTVNKTVSFYGNAKTQSAGCLSEGLLLVVLSPILLIGSLINNKEDKINRLTDSIKRAYGDYHGTLYNDFDKDVEEFNKLLDKHTKNYNYAQFVKEALGFLSIYMAKYPGLIDDSDRLEPFINNNIQKPENDEFMIFMQTIRNSAKAAISKNLKNVDKESLDKSIQEARELMQHAKQQMN